MSRTVTEPSVTRTSVPSQRSCVSHCVPLIVAEPVRPFVRNLPLPAPQRWRTTFFFDAEADARRPVRPHAFLKLDPNSCSSVTGFLLFGCVGLKTPSKKRAVCVDVSYAVVVGSTVPLVTSTIEPIGICCPAVSGTNWLLPGDLTFTVPSAGCALALVPVSGGGRFAPPVSV